MKLSPIEVAVGILITPQRRVLLASRPEGKPYAGWWEFPGGKVESGENVAQALARELHEELGVSIYHAQPWVVLEHSYEHAYVRLHFMRVTHWHGGIQAHEGQRWAWFDVETKDMPHPLLPATVPVLRWLSLPDTVGISHAAAMGLSSFDASLRQALYRGLRMLIVREPTWSNAQVGKLLDIVLPRCREHNAKVLVSSRHAPALWQRADGVQLRAVDAQKINHRPDLPWVGVSAHNAADIAHAAQLKADFCLLGSVLPTATHPDVTPLGWDGFVRETQHNALPVYALGGMKTHLLNLAQSHGAHGVAMMRDLWTSDNSNAALVEKI